MPKKPSKTNLCDMLMREGIVNQSIELAITSVLLLTELAAELGRKDGLKCALAWYEALERRPITREQAIYLDFGRANAIAQFRYGTEWQWEQPTLARELFFLRRAVSNPTFGDIPKITRCKILNNLGNRLRVAGRLIEALEYWHRVIEIQPNFGMALCNRARAFSYYAESLEDVGMQALFFWVAQKEASAAIAKTAIYTDVSDKQTRELAKNLKDSIGSILDVNRIEAEGIDPLTWPDDSASEEEQYYRKWCLDSRLFLNPANDLGRFTVASVDSLGLAAHVVRVDSSHIFESFFGQMKQEYVSARWMLYEGLEARAIHFSDRNVPLQATSPRPTLSLAIERVRAAFRITYSLFDKVAFFLNSFMGLGIPEKQVSFRRLWSPEEKKPLRKDFADSKNWCFCALYWLAKDFFEKENDDVAEPEARHLSDIRNHLEHKYLRVTADEPEAQPPDDLAFMVSRKDFEAKTLHLLGLARSALIYLAIGVGIQERLREPSRLGISIEELPATPTLPDEEKV